MQNIEKRTVGKVMPRLVPFLIVCYFVAYIDRVNIGFAKLQMSQVLGLSEAAFGLGAGLFFLGYFLFEVRLIIRLPGYQSKHAPSARRGGGYVTLGS
jgi:ACS family tartrate transporter-like MFS transporter